MKKTMLQRRLNKKRAVIFDLGNVLLAWDSKKQLPRFREYLQKERPLEEIGKIIYYTGSKRERGRDVHRNYHLGKITTEQFYTHIKLILPFKEEMTIEIFRSLWPDRFSKIEESIELLHELGHHQRYLLSDTNEMDADWTRVHYPEIFAHFDAIFLSHEKGVDKYNFEAWNNILKHTQLPQEFHVFIDDREDHVMRAQEVGMKGIVFRSAKKLRQELVKLGYL